MKKFLSAIVMPSFILLTGCTTAKNASFVKMTIVGPVKKIKNRFLIRAVTVKTVIGGRETNPSGVSQINNEGLRSALVQSLRKADLYSPELNAEYELFTTLNRLNQPAYGLDMTVTCEIHYKLNDILLKKIIYDRYITSSYTALFTDSFAGVERLKMANEGAVRKNIAELISDLYTGKLKSRKTSISEFQTIFLNDSSRIVGKIIKQTRTHVTVKTKYTTITIHKNNIKSMKYK